MKNHIFDLDVLTNIYRYPPRVSVSERHGKVGSKDGVQIWNRSQHFKIKVTNLDFKVSHALTGQDHMRASIGK